MDRKSRVCSPVDRYDNANTYEQHVTPDFSPHPERGSYKYGQGS